MATTTITAQTLTNDSGNNLDGTIVTNEVWQQLLTNINALIANSIEFGTFVTAPAQPRARVFHNATQALTTGTLTALTFNSEDFDVGALHDPVTNNSRITIPAGGAGCWLFIAKINFDTSAAGTARAIRFRKNGADVGTEVNFPPVAQIVIYPLMLIDSGVVAADYFEVWGFQDTGGNLNVGSAARVLSNEFSAVKLW